MSEPQETPTSNEPQQQSFADQATGDQVGLVAEFVDFLKYNKEWWLTPIVLVLMGVGVLVLVGSTTAAPFIYTLF